MKFKRFIIQLLIPAIILSGCNKNLVVHDEFSEQTEPTVQTTGTEALTETPTEPEEIFVEWTDECYTAAELAFADGDDVYYLSNPMNYLYKSSDGENTLICDDCIGGMIFDGSDRQLVD